MGIVTKSGDNGTTSLCFGEKVFKDDIRIETCGVVDELCAYLGMSRSMIKRRQLKKMIENIQRDLFVIGTEVATTPHNVGKLKKRITPESIDRIEAEIKRIENSKNIGSGRFHISGEDLISSVLDVSRTIARKAERHICSLYKKNKLKNRTIVIYMNRLSDLLYLLTRYCEKRHCRLG